MNLTVLQSYRTADVPPWIGACLESVRGWARRAGHTYRFTGDEIFDLLPESYREKTRNRPMVGTDLGRLLLARDHLARGAEAVLWLDADVLVVDVDRFDPVAPEAYAFGREIWIQSDKKGRLEARRNVHNAVCFFRPGNPILDFYIHACETLVACHDGDMVPQFVGPKLLSHLHNLLGFPLIDGVAMASPLVLRDLAAGGGPALDLLRRSHAGPASAVNLCASLVGGRSDGVDVTAEMMEAAVGRLTADPSLLAAE